MSRFRFVDDTRTDYPVKRLCEVLKINRSSYYKRKATAPQRQQRLLDDAAMAARITVVFNAHDGCYGAKRVTAELNDLGDPGAAQTPSSPESPVGYTQIGSGIVLVNTCRGNASRVNLYR